MSASPGTLVRWSVPGTGHCAMKDRSWAALLETCYYPIDLLQKPGIISISRWGFGPREYARISVAPFDYGTEEIELPDIPQAHPSLDDLKRVSRDQVLESKVWSRKEGPARFTLPLGPPSKPFPTGKSFGVKRVFNGKPAPQPHTGIDYPTPVGSPVLAVADGTVVLAADLFFAGNAVFIDHGDGLVSMYFHLAKINVTAGEDVTKGHELGKVGSTGRATGPHLFFGVRWHGARINPDSLFVDPSKIPDVQAGVAAKARSECCGALLEDERAPMSVAGQNGIVEEEHSDWTPKPLLKEPSNFRYSRQRLRQRLTGFAAQPHWDQFCSRIGADIGDREHGVPDFPFGHKTETPAARVRWRSS